VSRKDFSALNFGIIKKMKLLKNNKKWYIIIDNYSRLAIMGK